MVVKRSAPEEQGHWDEEVRRRLTGDEEIIDSLEYEAKVDLFRKVAKEKIWPAYKSQFGALWDQIENFTA